MLPEIVGNAFGIKIKLHTPQKTTCVVVEQFSQFSGDSAPGFQLQLRTLTQLKYFILKTKLLFDAIALYYSSRDRQIQIYTEILTPGWKRTINIIFSLLYDSIIQCQIMNRLRTARRKKHFLFLISVSFEGGQTVLKLYSAALDSLQWAITSSATFQRGILSVSVSHHQFVRMWNNG